jgi:4-hydroxy-tetrahydrodipicolinate synthase
LKVIEGSLVALVTPFNDDGSVDWQRLDELVEWHVQEGTNAIVAVGTTGESATLSVSEHCAVIKAVVAKVAGRVPVVAGTGANATAEAIELTHSAKKAGADACLLVTPYYNKPTQEGLYQHFKKIAEAVDIPQILYNVPGRTACDMSNATVLRLADIDNIVGLKDATGDVARGSQLIKDLQGRIAVWSGDDGTALELMLNGAKGDISVTANIAPRQMAEMCRLAIAGDRAGAEAANAPLLIWHERLFLEANPIPVKWALFEMARIGQALRLPLTPLDSKYRESLAEALRSAKLID